MKDTGIPVLNYNMYYLIENTLHLLTAINPNYMSEFFEKVNRDGNVITMVDAKGTPSGVYVRMEELDTNLFRIKKIKNKS